MARDNMDTTTRGDNMTPTELRKQVDREMVNDAVEVDTEGEETTISLFYLEPESETKLVKTPIGHAIAVVESETDALIAELMDDIQSVTSPDRMDVADENGFYVIELTYKEGNSW